MKYKLAIIGASYLQEPLIEKAKGMNIETHVFAWAAGDIGEKTADYFYPISIVEKEKILEKCREIGVDGICSIASDLAMVTVNYVAEKMGLIGNTIKATSNSTNKHIMRRCFEKNGDPSPKSILVSSVEDLDDVTLSYPIIVKPTDRSGSRGITKLKDSTGLAESIEYAKSLGFEQKALVEEFAEGNEYSVECITWNGVHHFLNVTKKYTTGAPHFIETAHLEPSDLSEVDIERVKKVIFHALSSLEITYGASHSEFKMSESGDINIIEIGARMGGDCIGSALVELVTGFDFVKAVIQVALGIEPQIKILNCGAAAIRFVFDQTDLCVLEKLKQEHREFLVEESIESEISGEVSDSSSRFGYFIMKAGDSMELLPYLPQE